MVRCYIAAHTLKQSKRHFDLNVKHYARTKTSDSQCGPMVILLHEYIKVDIPVCGVNDIKRLDFYYCNIYQ